MRLRTKVTLLIVALVVGGNATMALLSVSAGQAQLRESISSSLLAVGDLKGQAFERFIARNERSLEQIARRAELRTFATGLELGARDGAGEGPEVLDEILQEEVDLGGRFVRLSVVDAVDGRVVASSDPALVDTYRDHEPWFVPGATATFTAPTVWSLQRQATQMGLATPIAGPSGDVVALLSADARLDVLASLIGDFDGDTTTDSYLVNGFNFFVTEGRYTQDAALRQAIHTEGVEACLDEGVGVGVYEDYRDVRVLGAYRWLPERQVCVVVEMDEEEAFAPLASHRRRVLGLGLATAVTALAAGLFLVGGIVRSIEEVTAGAQQLGAGRLDHRIATDRRDELGDLARATNAMAADLQASMASRAELEAEAERRSVAEAALEDRAQQLARSNEELQQFAYVASHDLQEPLRMVSSYVELLGSRYSGQLDDDADDFIAFAVDGAARMKALINDLLAFSRVETRGNVAGPVSMAAVLADAVNNLQVAVEESGSIVSVSPDAAAVTLEGDGIQLTQLFQNLIGNAIKFNDKAEPRVEVDVDDQGQRWVFSVRDNGIGIEPQHFERVFTIFQRLRDVTDAPGTGIGLAVARKIAGRHGGEIWVESEHGNGSTFFIALPNDGGPPGPTMSERHPVEGGVGQRS